MVSMSLRGAKALAAMKKPAKKAPPKTVKMKTAPKPMLAPVPMAPAKRKTTTKPKQTTLPGGLGMDSGTTSLP